MWLFVTLSHSTICCPCRVSQCLGKLAQQPNPEPDGKAADKAEALQRASSTSQAAVRCLLDALAALDVWATPIKDANQRSVEAQEANSSASSSSSDRAGADRQGAGDSSGGAQGEMERFGAAKSAKESLSRGLALFNGKDPLKGLEQLVADGLLQRSPAAVSGMGVHAIGHVQVLIYATAVLTDTFSHVCQHCVVFACILPQQSVCILKVTLHKVFNKLRIYIVQHVVLQTPELPIPRCHGPTGS